MQDLTPVKIVEIMDKYVYGQNQAKKVLAIALRNRWRFNQLTGIEKWSIRKQNVILMGPTGSGKTALINVLRNQFDIPVLELDATEFTESGYKGRNVSDIGVALKEMLKTVNVPEWFRNGGIIQTDDATTVDTDEVEAIKKIFFDENGKMRDASEVVNNPDIQAQIQRKTQELLLQQADAPRDEKSDRTLARLQAASEWDKYGGDPLPIKNMPEDHKKATMLYAWRGFILGLWKLDLIDEAAILGADWESIVIQDDDGTPHPLFDMLDVIFGIFNPMLMAEILEDEDIDQEKFEEVVDRLGSAMNLGLVILSSFPDAALAPHGVFVQHLHDFTTDVEETDDLPMPWRQYDDEKIVMWLMTQCANLEDTVKTFIHYPDLTYVFENKTKPFELTTGPQPSKSVTATKTVKPKRIVTPREFIEAYAVVFIDEIDKLIAVPGSSAKSGVSDIGVQRSLLKVVEGGLYSGIDTTNILFIGAGSFAHAPVTKLMPELQGRFPLRAQLEPLSEEALIQICKLGNSQFHGYCTLLKIEGIAVHFDEDTYKYIAEQTFIQNDVDNLGARRLGGVVDEVFMPAMYQPELYKEKGFDVRGEMLREGK